MSITNRQLNFFYETMNTILFKGKLPVVRVRFHPRRRMSGHLAYLWIVGDEFREIRLARGLHYENVIVLSLLHEMCHIALYPYVKHGPKFYRLMLRLLSSKLMIDYL